MLPRLFAFCHEFLNGVGNGLGSRLVEPEAEHAVELPDGREEHPVRPLGAMPHPADTGCVVREFVERRKGFGGVEVVSDRVAELMLHVGDDLQCLIFFFERAFSGAGPERGNRLADSLARRACGIESFPGEVQRRPIMRAEREVAEVKRVVSLRLKVTERMDVSEGL